MKRMPRARNRRNDAFHSATVSTEKANERQRKQRRKLLASLSVTEYFAEGSISIDKKTCEGVGCKLCIKVCPTNALYWKMGEVGITKELCIYCGACVLACIVSDCIRITRKRAAGEIETFSKPKDFMVLQEKINTKRRFEKINEVKHMLSKPKGHLKRRKSKAHK
jgi:Fe-S-cluster-containing hydrogenase component 2